MHGTRHSTVAPDGTPIGLLTAGDGPALLLVHGGMSQIETWGPVWDALTANRRVTAIDRRGRGSSGDTAPYALEKEYDDVAAVACLLAEQDGGPVDVFGHSYGATCVLGAAARGAPFRRVVLYEPPGPRTVPLPWVERASALVADGRPGPAMMSFLTEIIGLSAAEIERLRNTPLSYDVMAVVTATLPREARALTGVDLPGAARAAARPVRLLLGATSPAWASEITQELAAVLPDADVVVLEGQGHLAIDGAPRLVAEELYRFLGAG